MKLNNLFREIARRGPCAIQHINFMYAVGLFLSADKPNRSILIAKFFE